MRVKLFYKVICTKACLMKNCCRNSPGSKRLLSLCLQRYLINRSFFQRQFVLIFFLLSLDTWDATEGVCNLYFVSEEIHLGQNELPHKWKQIVRPTMQHLGPPLLVWHVERGWQMRQFILVGLWPYGVTRVPWLVLEMCTTHTKNHLFLEQLKQQ